MNEWIIFLMLVISFWSIMIMAKNFLPKSIEVKPFYIMWKTTRFNKFIDNMASKWKFFWKVIFNIGIAMSIGGSIYITYILAKNLFLLFFKAEEASPVSLLIPGITLSPTLNTLFFFSIAIIIIIVSHELSHGIIARIEGIKIKSTGLILLAIIPGAFVEPDENDLNNARKLSQARIYAAGSTTNIIIALFALLLLSNFPLIISPLYETTSSGVMITGIVPNSPADGNLNNWDVIIKINNKEINNINDLEKILKTIPPNSMANITIIRGNEIKDLSIILGKSPTSTSSYIGVYIYPYFKPKFFFIPSFIPFYLSNSLNWIYFLSLNIGLINLMPIPGLDGDKLANTILKFLFKNGFGLKISQIIRFICLMILILNISMSFIIFPSFKFG